MFDVTVYNAVKKGLCKSKTESFPIGSGDIGANVWADKEGNINVLISKTDAVSEIGRLLKVGLLKLKFSKPIFLDEEPESILDLSDGSVTVKNSVAQVKIAAFRNTSLLAARFTGAKDVQMMSEPIIWRDKLYYHDTQDASARYHGCPFELKESADVQFDDHTIYHYNEWSYVDYTKRNQHFRTLTDYIKNNCFAYSFGSNQAGDTVYISVESGIVNDPSSLVNTVKQGVEGAAGEDNFEKYLAENKKYWTDYFGKYYISLSGNQDARDVGRLYTLQKYMIGCVNQGKLPIKFNGSIFTVSGAPGKAEDEDYDFRCWGGDYWAQNTRLIYWNMLYMGDFEGMKVWFDFLYSRLPAFKENAYALYHVDGIHVPETHTINGTYSDSDYGFSQENNEDYGVINPYVNGYFHSALELSFLMLEFLSYSGQKEYFERVCYPFIKEALVFYRERFKVKDGKMLIYPVTSLETWWDVENDAPSIYGLKVITKRLAELGYNTVIDPETIPEISTEIRNDCTVLAPCEVKHIPKWKNFENPELYSVFPYFIFHSTEGLPQIIQDTFDQRIHVCNAGWAQDLIQAALLLRKEKCEKELPDNFREKAEGYYFDAYFGPNHDWMPDQDHGSTSSIALRMMLLQDKNDKILINPVLPTKWKAQFRLPAGNQKVVEHK